MKHSYIALSIGSMTWWALLKGNRCTCSGGYEGHQVEEPYEELFIKKVLINSLLLIIT